ncbi:MAG: histidine phosphatase family protein [Bacteroidota bacterium]|nr:histidine phosphatase family protein [Bacteroidota bacterium]MDX5427996.1 histidine phosphatase family protein [Bacteroidota bacterium]MDX5447428.1 histidine phosphatase family protein [Bacteroidota bacterium]MDX5505840.1 histidine phosphatase family protein [Bacteroidota bacterium]
MKILYLVRHAKSTWQYDQIEDYDRPLKGRGIRDAHVMSGLWEQGFEVPEILISSPATRALHTAIIFARNINYPLSEIQMEEDLYLTSYQMYWEVVKMIDDEFNCAMVFGHNPAITKFVNSIVPQSVDNVPTTGVVCFKFHADRWAQVGKDAELLYFEYPKKIKKDR